MRLIPLLLLVLLAGCSAPIKTEQFTDPRTGETGLVAPGYLYVHYHPLDRPWNSPGYFDTATQEEAAAYGAWAAGGYKTDPELRDFLASEGAKVITYSNHDTAFTISPRDNRSLADTIVRWTSLYSGILDSIQPIYVGPHSSQ